MRIGNTKLVIVKGDITRQDTDAIVNAANIFLRGGSGVDGAIHKAGGPSVLEECKKVVPDGSILPTGNAVITTSGNLPSKYIIHTVGPIWKGGKAGEEALLSSAYRESIKLAESRGLQSMSFPSISTGVFGYPVDKAAKVAIKAVTEALSKDSSIKEVRLVLYDDKSYNAYIEAAKPKVLVIDDSNIGLKFIKAIEVANSTRKFKPQVPPKSSIPSTTNLRLTRKGR